jgi:Flp pilus assembly protein TadG
VPLIARALLLMCRRQTAPRTGRATMGLLVALSFPVLILIGSLSVDQSYVYIRDLMLRQAVEASAMAGATELASYYAAGDQSTSQITTAAQQFAQLNLPVARFGNVVASANVALGNWNASSGTFTSLADSGGTNPDSVQVTGYATVANDNPIRLFFGGIYGKPTVDARVTAVAGFGSAQPFNTIIVNDLSGSFASSIGNQQTADNAILNCVAQNAAQTSFIGVTAFDGHATVMQPLVQASANAATVRSVINGLNSCGHAGMPACSGSNVAAGLYAAIQQFSDPAFANQKKNVVIITDGVPNADPITYATGDGIYPTPSSTTPTCTTHCTDANLWTMARNQAANAASAGISVSTIYYSGDTSASLQASYAASLASLVGGSGVAMVAPTQAQINATYAGFCATMSAALKQVH